MEAEHQTRASLPMPPAPPKRLSPRKAIAYWRRREIVTDARPPQGQRACVYCGADGHGTTRDHVVPRSKGGGSGMGNIEMACGPCNNDKADTDLRVWARFLERHGDSRAENAHAVADRHGLAGARHQEQQG